MHERAGRARMVEMNVRQQNRAEIGHRDPRLFERRAKCRQRARRSGIDEGHAPGTVQHDGGDDTRHAKEVEIDIRQARSKDIHLVIW
jgi:hypothetical protein